MAEHSQVNLTQGGTAVVMVGNTGMIKEFANHAQVRFVDCKQTPGEQLEHLVPNNTKIIIITEGIPQYHQTWIFAYAKRRNVVYLIRRNNQAVYETLKLAFKSTNGEVEVKPTVEEIKDAQVRGKYDRFLPLDWARSNAELARDLERKCKELNIACTFSALTQWVGVQRKKIQGGTVPKSARPKLDVLVEMFDHMIKDMGDMRDFIIDTVEENKVLRAKVERFRKAMDE